MLSVQVAGTYPPGSLGNPHAKAISAATLHGLVLTDPVCLLFDFQHLTYTWGNALLGIYQDTNRWLEAEREPNEPFHPVLTVLGPQSKKGWLSLMTPVGGNPPPNHFMKWEQAFEEGVRQGREWHAF